MDLTLAAGEGAWADPSPSQAIALAAFSFFCCLFSSTFTSCEGCVLTPWCGASLLVLSQKPTDVLPWLAMLKFGPPMICLCGHTPPLHTVPALAGWGCPAKITPKMGSFPPAPMAQFKAPQNLKFMQRFRNHSHLPLTGRTSAANKNNACW